MGQTMKPLIFILQNEKDSCSPGTGCYGAQCFGYSLDRSQ